ncbi:HD domain-containing protein [Cellulomonas sp. JZ18]|uniref:HD domain-containing protein n=1 Tax=Cellulomonas sp. JZ18 TaxID=2654191 RepID=UPI0012D47BDF|nr:HD domain-containing protein [Cellulomonas sp. JZ18]QGQ19875.1 HD domain-containing protein [Cellulomonas sp. JZ18]
MTGAHDDVTPRPVPGVADTVGLGGVHVDPVWRTRTALRPVEAALLRTWPVRRLGLVAHAGAVATVTTQTYSRLEHSLGVLGLVAHLAADDATTRVAALLHDVGHAPLSHTLEGIGGIDHHRTGARRVRGLGAVLADHGLDAEAVLATVAGERPSVLAPRPGLMTLDHLDSYVRSAHAHGRAMPAPADLLGDLTVDDGAVRTSAATASVLDGLVEAEVAYHRSELNVLAVGVVRHLVRRWVGDGGADAVARVGAMTDAELVAALLAHPRTADDTRRFLADPLAWRVVPAGPGAPPDGAEPVPAVRPYLTRALVTGQPTPRAVPAPALGHDHWVVPEGEARAQPRTDPAAHVWV